jgi:hypothetical protein
VPEPRRFPPPWSVEETDACFIVRDANRQALRLFRGGGKTTSGDQVAHPRRATLRGVGDNLNWSFNAKITIGICATISDEPA